MANIRDLKTSRTHLEELLKAARERAQSATTEGRVEVVAVGPEAAELTLNEGTVLLPISGKRIRFLSPGIDWNEEQVEAIDRALAGHSFCLIGAAGTGKTTVVKEIVLQLIASGTISPIAKSTKYLVAGSPGIVVNGYTNRAVINSAKPMPQEMKKNCLTIHKLLEYEPRFYEALAEDGSMKNKMEFIPKFNALNPLPTSIRVLIDDESSMTSVELYETREEALQHRVQHIFLGDIQQLPPVYGSAILGFKLLELPVVELTQVYRQALESPILRLAHNVLQGKLIGKDQLADWNVPGKLTLHPWKKKLDETHGVQTIGAFFRKLIDEGKFNEQTDIILVPFNKAFGSLEINKVVAQKLGTLRSAVVHEVIAGFNKHYLAEGDKVLYNKEDAHIVRIVKNHAYFGKRAQTATTTLDRWGIEQATAISKSHKQEVIDDLSAEMDIGEIDDLLLAASTRTGDVDDRTHDASHIIDIRLDYGSGEIVTLDSANEINSLLLGYCLTVHKAQGSEWQRVYFILHNSHAVMLSRELLYTAITRAKESLYIICEPDTFIRGTSTQRIKGNTLREKAEYFMGKLEKLQGEKGMLMGMKVKQ